MFLAKKYKIRQRLLKALNEVYVDNYSPNTIDMIECSLRWDQLAERTKLTEEVMSPQLDYLIHENEILAFERDHVEYYGSTSEGRMAYHEKKYPTLGRKERRDEINETLKLISVFVLLIIAVVTFYINIVEVKKNAGEIEKLKKETRQLRDSLRIHTKK